LEFIAKSGYSKSEREKALTVNYGVSCTGLLGLWMPIIGEKNEIDDFKFIVHSVQNPLSPIVSLFSPFSYLAWLSYSGEVLSVCNQWFF
jgi:hypothetical protein